MATKPSLEVAAPMSPESLGRVRAKALESVSALAEANERVVGKLIDLSSTAARETFRTYAELQSALLDAMRTAPAPALLSGQGLEELRRDPLAWYGKGVVSATDATQRIAKLVETNAQILGRGVERFEASAQQMTKEIRDAVATCVDRIKDIHGRS
jgi:hypothetical protein